MKVHLSVNMYLARGLADAGLWSLNATSEQLTLAFPNAVEVSQLTLLIKFNYTLSEGLSGFYRSTYKGALPLPLSLLLSSDLPQIDFC